MIHLRFKQHLIHWFHLPLLAFPMLPNVANDPSQANFDIVSQTSDTQRRRSISGRSWRMAPPENGSSRRRTAVHRCGERRKRACRRKPPAARTGRVTRLPRRIICDGSTKRSSQKNGLCSLQNPERVSCSIKSQRTTVDHNETLNNLTKTQSLPRAKVKPRPRTHGVFFNTLVCCTCVLRLCMVACLFVPFWS